MAHLCLQGPVLTHFFVTFVNATDSNNDIDVCAFVFGSSSSLWYLSERLASCIVLSAVALAASSLVRVRYISLPVTRAYSCRVPMRFRSVNPKDLFRAQSPHQHIVA